jgi:hypothetical protein
MSKFILFLTKKNVCNPYLHNNFRWIIDHLKRQMPESRNLKLLEENFGDYLYDNSLKIFFNYKNHKKSDDFDLLKLSISVN